MQPAPEAARRRRGPGEIRELLKVQGGQIHRIEAVLNQVPYGMGSGWSTWEQSRSDQAQW